MKVILSKNFHINKLSRVERKLVQKRITELSSCKNLGEMRYGRVHILRARYVGSYGIRIGKTSRLIISPIEFDAEYSKVPMAKRKYHVIGVLVCYSPNHYQNYF